MKVDGSCHCGRITYEGMVDPEKISVCHCTDCQSLTGSTYRVSAPVPKESFRLLTGTPKIYIKTADSGSKRVHAFCADCSAPIYSCAVENPPVYNLRVGGLQQRAQLPPKRQIWCQSALPWAMDLHGLPQLARQ